MNTTTTTTTNTAPSPASLLKQPAKYDRNPGVIAAEVGVVAGLAGTAYIHLKELSGKFAEVPYLGVGYALLAVACVAAIALIVARDKRGWYLGGATALATIIGFTLTRTVGLPGSTDDIGNWSETIGVWSLLFEGLAVAVTAVMITLHFRKA